jgi:hypothetical protein
MHIVDEIFADEIEAMDGFEAYHALDCGGGEIVSSAFFATRRSRRRHMSGRLSSSVESWAALISSAPR